MTKCPSRSKSSWFLPTSKEALRASLDICSSHFALRNFFPYLVLISCVSLCSGASGPFSTYLWEEFEKNALDSWRQIRPPISHLFYAEQTHFSQPHLTHSHMYSSSPGSPLLDLVQHVSAFPFLRSPKMVMVLPVWSQKCHIKGKDLLATLANTDWDRTACLCCKGMLLTCTSDCPWVPSTPTKLLASQLAS